MTRARSSAIAVVAAVVVAGLPAGAARAGEEVGSADMTIVGGARRLTSAEVRSFDITDTDRGRAILRATDDEPGSLDVDRRPHRVFAFDDQVLVIDAKSPMTVTEGLNNAGNRVYDVVPQARPVSIAAGPGYAVPPAGAWVYNTDGGFTYTVGTWKRMVFWTINLAFNWKPCGACQPHQYWRIYGKMQASVLSGSSSSQGYKRAWLEFDNNAAWGGSPWEFEVPQPEESHAGEANQTITVGFTDNADFELGIPPFKVGGGVETTYLGSMTRSTENWHPVVRSELASGGVQWCRYESGEYGGAKVVTTRVGLRQAVGAQLGGWNILHGMQDFTSSCPSQM